MYVNKIPTRCNFIQFICKQLYMFQVVSPPIIRSTFNCIYSIWYWSTVVATGRYRRGFETVNEFTQKLNTLLQEVYRDKYCDSLIFFVEIKTSFLGAISPVKGQELLKCWKMSPCNNFNGIIIRLYKHTPKFTQITEVQQIKKKLRKRVFKKIRCPFLLYIPWGGSFCKFI